MGTSQQFNPEGKFSIQLDFSSYLTLCTTESFKQLILYGNWYCDFKVKDCKIIYIIILILYATKFSYKYLGLGLKHFLGNQYRKMDPWKYKACPFNVISQSQ